MGYDVIINIHYDADVVNDDVDVKDYTDDDVDIIKDVVNDDDDVDANNK